MFYMTFATILLAVTPPGAPATPAPPQAQAQDDSATPDVVVIARKLRKLRLVYKNDGRELRSCSARISSGDHKLDDMACRVLGWCVRKGFGEPKPALACLHWWQARLDTIAAAQQDAQDAAAAKAR